MTFDGCMCKNDIAYDHTSGYSSSTYRKAGYTLRHCVELTALLGDELVHTGRVEVVHHGRAERAQPCRAELCDGRGT